VLAYFCVLRATSATSAINLFLRPKEQDKNSF
jgi:hypothetical protein